MMKELLKQVKAVINTPEKWCQHVIAQDKYGNGVFDDDPNAVKFCISGAIWRVFGHNLEGRHKIFEFLDSVVKKKNPEQDLPKFNDSHTHEEVIALLDEAIEL